MQILFLTFVLFSLAVLAMTVCVLISGRNLRGSCGGPSCECVNQGNEIGSCEVEEGRLPIHRAGGNREL